MSNFTTYPSSKIDETIYVKCLTEDDIKTFLISKTIGTGLFVEPNENKQERLFKIIREYGAKCWTQFVNSQPYETYDTDPIYRCSNCDTAYMSVYLDGVDEKLCRNCKIAVIRRDKPSVASSKAKLNNVVCFSFDKNALIPKN